MNLLAIIAATLVAGIGSVWLAALLLRAGTRRGGGLVDAQHLLSLAAGALLATAFMHLLPEAFEGGVEPAALFAVLLFGLVFFFLLDKAELWHHGHEHGHGPERAPSSEAAFGASAAQAAHAPGPHGGPGHEHAHEAGVHIPGRGPHHTHVHSPRGGGGWTVLTGDSVHCFGDGILIASAFVADLRLGLVAAIAVLAHEVPHHIGDLVVLRQSSPDSRAALLKVSLAGTMTALGGVVGWWLVERLHAWLPYFLVLASSSFVYVALADLIPQLQRRLTARQTAAQVLWLALGIVLVTLASRLAHGEHEHGRSHAGSHARLHPAAPARAVSPA